MLGPRFCARAFSSCGEWGPLFIAVRGPLTVAASLVAEHRLQTRRLSSCGSWALLLCGMWNLPRPGLEPMFPALAGRLSTTAPPGKPRFSKLLNTEYVLLVNLGETFFQNKEEEEAAPHSQEQVSWASHQPGLQRGVGLLLPSQGPTGRPSSLFLFPNRYVSHLPPRPSLSGCGARVCLGLGRAVHTAGAWEMLVVCVVVPI